MRLISETTMPKDTSHDRENDVSQFDKGQIIGMHLSERTPEEIAKTTKIGLRTVQHIIKDWKESGDPSSSRKKCGRKKLLDDCERASSSQPDRASISQPE